MELNRIVGQGRSSEKEEDSRCWGRTGDTVLPKWSEAMKAFLKQPSVEYHPVTSQTSALVTKWRSALKEQASSSVRNPTTLTRHQLWRQTLPGRIS